MAVIIIKIDDDSEQIYNRLLSILINDTACEIVQPKPFSVLSFPGLEIKLHQRRVLRDGEDVKLTRLEYSTLVFLASSPGRVFTRTQIFETVWNIDSDSCHSSVVNVIYNLRKKIEPDSKDPTYIKTVLGVGYKFDG